MEELRCITAKYVVTLLSNPEVFELNNQYEIYVDSSNINEDNQIGAGGQDMEQMMQAMMGGGGFGSLESLASN